MPNASSGLHFFLNGKVVEPQTDLASCQDAEPEAAPAKEAETVSAKDVEGPTLAPSTSPGADNGHIHQENFEASFILEKVGRNAAGVARRLLLFDGTCRLCMGFVDMTINRDGQDLFRFAPLQSELGQKVLSHYGHPSNLDSVVLVRDGQASIKSDAALDTLGELNGPLSALWAFKALPLFIRDVGYDVVAKSRYSLLGHSSISQLGAASASRLVDRWEPDPSNPLHVCNS